MNFIWSVDEYEFNQKLGRLSSYIESGNKIIPGSVDTDGFDVYGFVNSCRRRMNESDFPNWKKEKLSKLGIVPTTNRDDAFKNNVKLLQEYYSEFNTHYISKECIYNGVNLGTISQTLRKFYKQNKLSQERINILKEIGFEFECDRNKQIIESYRKNFLIHFDQLKECIKHNDKITTYTKWDGFAIGSWLNRQKVRYKRGIMNEEEYNMLKEIGIDIKQIA